MTIYCSACYRTPSPDSSPLTSPSYTLPPSTPPVSFLPCVLASSLLTVLRNPMPPTGLECLPLNPSPSFSPLLTCFGFFPNIYEHRTHASSLECQFTLGKEHCLTHSVYTVPARGSCLVISGLFYRRSEMQLTRGGVGERRQLYPLHNRTDFFLQEGRDVTSSQSAGTGGAWANWEKENSLLQRHTSWHQEYATTVCFYLWGTKEYEESSKNAIDQTTVREAGMGTGRDFPRAASTQVAETRNVFDSFCVSFPPENWFSLFWNFLFLLHPMEYPLIQILKHSWT